MNNGKKVFSLFNFKLKIYFLLFLFAVDIVMNSFTQFIAYGNSNSIQLYSLNFTVKPTSDSYFIFCIHLLVQLLMLFVVLSIFMNTFHFQLGMVGSVCSRFKFSFILIALYPIFFLSENIYRLIYLGNVNSDKNNNDVTIWDNGLYKALYFIKFIVGFIYYVFILDAVMELGKEKYYRPEMTKDGKIIL